MIAQKLCVTKYSEFGYIYFHFLPVLVYSAPSVRLFFVFFCVCVCQNVSLVKGNINTSTDKLNTEIQTHIPFAMLLLKKKSVTAHSLSSRQLYVFYRLEKTNKKCGI